MNTARILGSSTLVAALALTLLGCSQTSAQVPKVATVEKARSFNSEVCNGPAWIRERAPLGLCESAPVVDDDMSLRRLHLELERSGR